MVAYVKPSIEVVEVEIECDTPLYTSKPEDGGGIGGDLPPGYTWE